MGNINGTFTTIGEYGSSLMYNIECKNGTGSNCASGEVRYTTLSSILVGSYESSITTSDGIKYSIQVTLDYKYDLLWAPSGQGKVSLTIDVDLSPDGTKLINPIITSAVVTNLPTEFYKKDAVLRPPTCKYQCTYSTAAKQYIFVDASASYNYQGKTLTMERIRFVTEEFIYAKP